MTPNRPIQILMVEDSPLDAELILSRLEKGELVFNAVRVERREDFIRELETGRYDLVLADYSLPDFDGLSALELVRARDSDLPFIFVSGALGEEVAVETLHRGATDYVLKQRMGRLVQAIRRAMAERDALAERRLTAAALHRSEERARLALAAGRMVTCDIDVGTGKVTWSPDVQAVLGVPPEALTDHLDDFLAHVVPEDRERVRAAALGSWADAETQSHEFRMRRADGGIAVVQAFGRTLGGPGGRPTRVVGVLMDVTERRHAEERLRHVQRMEAIGRLAGGLAHESNNQMAVVIGFADFVLRRADLAPEVRDDIEQIRRAAERTALITRQLLSFSRRQPGRPEVAELNALVREFAPVLRRTIADRAVLELRLGSTCRVRIDRGQLEQVLLNLVLNAVDAMPWGGTLTLETSDVELTPDYAGFKRGVAVRTGGYAMLSVTDTGVGMSRQTLERIFEPFFTTKEVGKGTGLGLAAVYGIVKHADGYVWAYSEPGVGSTLKVYLPQVARSVEPAGIAEPVRGGTEAVLLVEDEESVRMVALRALRESGYEVHEARSGPEAIHFLTQLDGHVKLLVTDVAMPGMDGPELAAELKRRGRDLPVVFMSGYPEGHRDDGKRMDGVAYLEKPFAPDALLRVVRKVLDAKQTGGRAGGLAGGTVGK